MVINLTIILVILVLGIDQAVNTTRIHRDRVEKVSSVELNPEASLKQNMSHQTPSSLDEKDVLDIIKNYAVENDPDEFTDELKL
jgi:hypothetical protein